MYLIEHGEKIFEDNEDNMNDEIPLLPKNEVQLPVELQPGDNGFPLTLKTVNTYTVKYE